MLWHWNSSRRWFIFVSNKIQSYDYTVEETNRFKGLDLVDRMPEELRTKVWNTVQEVVTKPSPSGHRNSKDLREAEEINKRWQHKKKCIWVSSNQGDEPRAYSTNGSQSERQNQILCINAYIWNLERRSWWTYLKGSSGDTDIENRRMDTGGGGEREGGMDGGSNMETYTLPYVKQIANGNLLYDFKPGHWNNLDGWAEEGVSRGRVHR